MNAERQWGGVNNLLRAANLIKTEKILSIFTLSDGIF